MGKLDLHKCCGVLGFLFVFWFFFYIVAKMATKFWVWSEAELWVNWISIEVVGFWFFCFVFFFYIVAKMATKFARIDLFF